MKRLESMLCRKVALGLALTFLVACVRHDPQQLFAAGQDLLAKRQFNAAAIQVKNGLQSQPNSPEGRFLLGQILLEAGDSANAVVELRRALDLRYSADAVTPLILRADLQLGKYDSVIEEAREAKVLGAGAKAEVFTIVAAAYAARDDLPSARKSIADALSAQPDNVQARLVQARLSAAEADFKGALAVIDGIIAKAPADFDAHKLKGDVLSALNQQEAAVASYRKAIELRPESIAARAALIYAQLRGAQYKAGNKSFDDAVADYEELKKRAAGDFVTVALGGQLAFVRNDLRSAREFAQRLLRMAPEAPGVLQFAGTVEYQTRSYAQAETYLAKAMFLDQNSLVVRRWIAMTYLATGQSDKAIATLEKVMAKIDQNPEMLVLAGDAYLQRGNYAKAEEMLAKAIKLKPDDLSKRVALAVVRINKGNNETAVAELETIAATQSDTAADRALIAAYMSRGDLDKCLKAVDVFLRKEPGNPVVHDLRGRVLAAKGRGDEARKSFERALELNPSLYSAAEALASLDFLAGKPEDAVRRLESFVATNPGNAVAVLGLASLKGRTGAPAADVLALLNRAVAADPADSEARASLINFHVLNKDSKKAVAAGQDAAAAIPDSVAVFDALGQALRASGDINQALSTYAKLAAAQPRSPIPHTRAAEIYVDRKDTEAAIGSLRKALAIRPDLVEPLRMLIKLNVLSGRQQEALSIARDQQKSRPNNPFGYQMAGEILASQRSYLEAAEVYRSGIMFTGGPELATGLHGVLLAGGKGTEADKFASDWMRDHPKDRRFAHYMAEAAIVRGNFQDALKRNLELLKTEPDNPIVLNNTAFLAGRLKQPGALEYAEKANKIATNEPKFMDTLAELLADSGDVARALELSSKASRATPQNFGIKFSYARILLKAGKTAEAKKELEDLAKLGDKFAAQEEVAKLLKAL